MGVLADFQVSPQNPSTIVNPGTSTAYFPRLINVFFGYGAPVVTPSASNATGQLVIPGSQYPPAAVGQILRVIAGGVVTTFASYTYRIQVQINTGLLLSPGYTTLADTGTVGPVGGSGTWPWFLKACMTIGSAATAPTFPNVTGFYSGAAATSSGSTMIDLTAIAPPTNAAVMGGCGSSPEEPKYL